MWAEARKHEKKLKGLMVDFRKRAERRREFYDRIRSDPALFLQIHGNQLKVHIDPNLTSMAESSLMPWLGDKDNMIDRFDVRAHLDRLDIQSTTAVNANEDNADIDDVLERQINYERYRNLVQNDFLGLNESKFLQQIWFEERFGLNNNQKDVTQNKSLQKKKLAEKKATIAYNYDNEDSTSMTVQSKNNESSDSEDSSDEDYDFDTTVNIDQLDNDSGHRINTIAHKFGMKCDDFVKYLDEDKTEAEKIRIQKELENEKSLFTGRKSRRERRALKEQRLLILRATNVEESDKSLIKRSQSDGKRSQSSSDSEVSVDESKIEFITSFGGSSEDETRKEVIEKKPKQEIKRKQKFKSLANNKTEAIPVVYGPTLPGEDRVSSVTNTSFTKAIHSKQRTYRFNDSFKRSRSRSRSYDRYRKIGDRCRNPDMNRSSNRTPNRYRDRTRSRSRDRRTSRQRSRSRVRERDYRRDRNRDEDRSRRYRRSRSRDRFRRTRSKSRDRDRRRKSRSRSRRRSRSRNRDRDRSHRNSSKRSRSKSQNRKEFDLNELKTKTEKSNVFEEVINSTKSDEKMTEIEPKIENELNEEICESNETQTKEEITLKDVLPVKSYYRAALARQGMSGGSDEEHEQKEPKPESDEGSKKISNNTSCAQTGHKTSSTVGPQERLKKKMQALIDKQYKRDKRAEKEKLSKQQQEREDREEELREMTSKLKYRRELYRERRDSRSPSTSRSRSHSRSSSSSSSY